MTIAKISESSSGKRAGLCFLVICVFVGMRSGIYKSAPIGLSWNVRDLVMDVPRLICLGLVCLVMRKKWNADDGNLKPVIALTLSELAILGVIFALSWPRSFPSLRWIGAFSLSSLVVGVFEEVTFRGALLQSLREWKGESLAIVATAATFTICHSQAQPLLAWPWLFLIGLKFAMVRLMGARLAALVVLHTIYDAAFIFIGNPRDFWSYWCSRVGLEVMTTTAFFLWYARSRKPVATA